MGLFSVVMYTLLLSSLCLTFVDSHEAYATKVPNGRNVKGVDAIGHTDPAGGGIRNAFGRDFRDSGHTWTEALCQKDSDRDGQTNGEELGDPCCEWKPESAQDPLWSTGVSNPGDDASTSMKSLWPTYECLTTTKGSENSDSGSIGIGNRTIDSDSLTSSASLAWSRLTVATMTTLLILLATFAS
ncbi:hypothetical protein CCR75_006606 [Bremia lactucae]|uniref:Temptin Cys/Cys disulfide domain-containing protein n=1 Tax=Bremia lactucae TaxID=4779 RepID=A0A976FI53_BRELC|nr:hypothetical protein CCR75_006606 [Bremia lactucae]